MDDIIMLDDESKKTEAVVDHDDHPDITCDGDNVCVRLEFPFQTTFRMNGGPDRTETIDKVSFRRPNGGDYRALQSFTNEGERTVQMFLRLSGLKLPQFEKMAMSDIEFCLRAIENFSKGSRATGKI